MPRLDNIKKIIDSENDFESSNLNGFNTSAEINYYPKIKNSFKKTNYVKNWRRNLSLWK